MTFKKLARELCRREQKKIGVNIGQVNELVRCLFDVISERPKDFARLAVTEVAKRDAFLDRLVAEALGTAKKGRAP